MALINIMLYNNWALHRVCQWASVQMRVRPVTDVWWGGAVRVQDTRYVADDVSKLSLWTATISAGICGNWTERGREEQQEQEGTLEGLFLWVTVLLVLSPLVPLIENQTRKKSLSLFTPESLQFLFLAPPPLSFPVHSSFYWKPFFSLLRECLLIRQ